MVTHQEPTDRYRIVARLQSDRRLVLELLLSAGLLALGVSIAGSIIATGVPMIAGAIGAVALVGLAALVLVSGRFRNREHRIEVRGFLAHPKGTERFEPVAGYELSERIANYQRAIFSENPAFERQWDAEPLEGIWTPRNPTRGEFHYSLDLASVRLLRELLEYAVLELLSTHLTDYFHRRVEDRSRLTTYERGDVPDILLTNRVLDLLSRPMADRAAFDDFERDSNTVQAGGSDGAFFSKFDLVLPASSTVKRGDEGAIIIDGKYLTLSVKAHFEGFGSYVSWDFLRHYAKMDPDETSLLQVGFDLVVTLKREGLISTRGWEYHEWIESFLERLDRFASKERFLEAISWPAVAAVLRTVRDLDVDPD